MTWRGSTDYKDRAFSALAYLLPLVVALPFGVFVFQQLPFLRPLFLPLIPFAILYGQFPFGLIIFFALLFLVVRNERINHFIRFNTMQALLLDIFLILLHLVLSLFVRTLGPGSFIIETFYNVIFIGALAAVIFAFVQCARGLYAEIPGISQAVYAQVR
ncbi:Tic20-like protein [Rubidibacter lacunae KORDI 51-2]|uniref:Tic20-like protein n=1 Tax=Rubidibacter lacunae KORDI 51-2 TaxID=582515 RepID=U5DKW8_9CHRO|nr:Tic20 family protein [Rubidibacter lacunae]ERN41204.1 Tic20-like protein [Rubidibacter lacunae KORDI 51-2]